MGATRAPIPLVAARRYEEETPNRGRALHFCPPPEPRLSSPPCSFERLRHYARRIYLRDAAILFLPIASRLGEKRQRTEALARARPRLPACHGRCWLKPDTSHWLLRSAFKGALGAAQLSK